MLSIKKSVFLSAVILLSPACSHSVKKEIVSLKPDEGVFYVNKNERTIATPVQYKITGTCDGWPQINVKTAPGFCVGLVFNGEGTIMPRGILELSEKEFLISDMGPSWMPTVGKLYLLNTENNKSTLKVLLDGQGTKLKDAELLVVDRPNHLTKDRFDNVYIASASSISRFHADKIGTPEMIETVISNIPSGGIHPLKAIAFDKNNNMYVNVGSVTNVCQDFGEGLFKKAKPCPEVETDGHASIYKYTYNSDTKNFNPKFSIYAKGLRNSMVLMWDDEQDVLLEIENSRDAISNKGNLDDKQFPHDEMNLIYPNKNYGWPYCFDNNQNNPEFKKWDCSSFQKPYLLLPPHAAPLSGLYYKGDLFPDWYKKRYLFSFHGYENGGHRLVTFKRNEQLLPTGDVLSVVYGWDNMDMQGIGTPVGITEADDGSVYIVEDKNRKVLRLFYDATKGNGQPVKENLFATGKVSDEEANEILERKIALTERLKRSDAPIFSQVQAKVIDQSCISCHGGKNVPGIQLLQYDDVGNAKRIIDAKLVEDIYNRMLAIPNIRPMPPVGFKDENEKAQAVNLYKLWMDGQTEIPN